MGSLRLHGQRGEGHGYRQGEVIPLRPGGDGPEVGRMGRVHPDGGFDKAAQFRVFGSFLEPDSQAETGRVSGNACSRVERPSSPTRSIRTPGTWPRSPAPLRPLPFLLRHRPVPESSLPLRFGAGFRSSLPSLLRLQGPPARGNSAAAQLEVLLAPAPPFHQRSQRREILGKVQENALQVPLQGPGPPARVEVAFASVPHSPSCRLTTSWIAFL